MTDREMLELAARAAGYVFGEYGGKPARQVTTKIGAAWIYWNPREDDGDALRLAVDLYFHVNVFTPIDDETDHYPGFVEIWREGGDDPLITGYFKHPEERYATTRLAIFLAAAQIGKDMP